MTHFNLLRRILVKLEDWGMKPFFYIEEKVENSYKIEPFGFIWNLTHLPHKIDLWIHFHIIRRDLLEEYLQQDQELNEYFVKLGDEIEEERYTNEYTSNN